MKQKYMILKNEEEDAFKRMNALLYILKNNFGEEVIYFASNMDKVKKELTKCLSDLLNIRNYNFKMDYGTIKAVILDKDIKSEYENEKYVEIIRHCGYDILEYGSDILASDIIILTEYDSIYDAYWFTYQNIDDFANYIEDVLSIIEKECDDINDINFFNEINNEINDVINQYWGNTIEFDYAMINTVSKEIEQTIETLKKADYEYIKEVLKREKNQLDYDSEYDGWLIGNEYAVDFFYKNEDTYLNPKELKSFIETIIEEEILPISEIAKDFINYFESKYGLEDVTEDRICSNISKDCEFHSFETFGLSEEVVRQLRKKGVEIK